MNQQIRDSEIKNVMNVMDRSGHMSIEWNPNTPSEVENAEEIFDRMTGEGYQAFRVEGANQQGSRIKEFDPTARKIMLVPQLRGG